MSNQKLCVECGNPTGNSRTRCIKCRYPDGKYCSYCSTTKPLSEFGINSKMHIKSKCYDCYKKEYRERKLEAKKQALKPKVDRGQRYRFSDDL